MKNPMSVVFAWMLRKAIAMVKLEDRLKAVEDRVASLGADLKSCLNSFRAGIEDRIDSVKVGLEGRIDSIRAESKAGLESLRYELKAHVDEKLGRAEAHFDEKLGVMAARFDEKLGSMEARLRAHADERAAAVSKEVGLLGGRFDAAVTVHERLAAVETALALRPRP